MRSDRRAAARTLLALAIVHVPPRSLVLGPVPPRGRIREHLANRLDQSLSPMRAQRRRLRLRADLRQPQRLGRVNVSDARDHVLIEQRRLDRAAPARERDTERVGVEGRIVGSGPSSGSPSPASKSSTVESARMSVSATRVPSSSSSDARVKRGSSSPTLPILPVAIHAKVNRERAPIVEMEQLVLAAALHALDATPLQSAQARRRDALRERGVQQPQTRDDFPFRGFRELLLAPLRLQGARA